MQLISCFRLTYIRRTLLLVLTGVCLCAIVFTHNVRANPTNPLATVSYYVAPDGNDSNPGTLEQPFATVAKARDVVRQTKGTMTGDITIYLRGGTYTLDEALTFDERDSGSGGFNVIYTAYQEEQPVISGGQQVTGWAQVSGQLYWKAPFESENFRQLYVNGERRQRARTEEPLIGTAWTYNSEGEPNGITFDPSEVPETFVDPANMQYFSAIEWRSFLLPVEGVTSSNGQMTAVTLEQPYLREALSMARNNSPTPYYNTPFYLENDLALLDNPGEWYFNDTTDELFYYPLPGENVLNAEVIAPSLLNLVSIEGSSLDNKVRNLRFEGITFAHAGRWDLPDTEGWFGWQSQALVRPRVNEVPASLSLNAAVNIVFERNVFEHLGVIGVGLFNGVQQITLQGNVLRDIEDSAIVVGSDDHDYIDEGEEVTQDNTIKNNVIYQSGQDVWGSAGIVAYYTTRLTIEHNDLSDLPYSGMGIGWGWSGRPDSTTARENYIRNNRIVNVMKKMNDGGGIYTIGQQPDSTVSGNYIKQVWNDYGGLYFDEGTAYYTATDNVVENVTRWLHIWTPTIRDIQIDRTWTTTDENTQNGTNISISNTTVVPDANWPAEAQAIIDNAGLEPAYQDLLALKPPTDGNTAPTVNAGPDTTIPLKENVRLTGIVSDDQKPYRFLKPLWSKESGPGTVTFTHGGLLNTTAAFSEPGTYVLKLTVDDGAQTVSDTLTVNVTEVVLGDNLALDKPTSAKSYWQEETISYPPENGNDGDINTGWTESFGDLNAWWQVDLGTATPISRVEFVTRQGLDQGPTRVGFEILASNDPEFTAGNYVVLANQPGGRNTPSVPHEGTWTTNVTDTTAYRYVRFAKITGWSWISELRVYGTVGQSQGNGLRYELFPASDLTGTPVDTGIHSRIDWDWGVSGPLSSGPTDNFSMRWTGQIQPRYSETYNIITRADDGVRLWVDDQLLVDNWIDQDVTERQGSITLQADQRYDVELEYYEREGEAAVQLLWWSPSQPREVIPQARLYPN
ncbi:MAG: hypothetical protein GFH27_549279n131 [Chloroflexi bacterium AL-W]|nr:hypothetical protein [Chloroflexi bacterium AL-N1]NOK65097.1 hypothetical protein [Chloroflexi bacterium AL-N10]NOK72636.1 hypothetical protein [Chloroflexi bacterium AL-N5]NOK79276.1 hypothetical protein [Chloroflexi bacterium AL-W]NOK87192.1 hypothetical protein [Chloroflexi bacterium AL-N15]